MTTTPAGFAVKMAKVAREIKTTQARTTKAAAMVVKQSVQVQLTIAAPRGRLNVGKNGSKVGVSFKMFDDNTALVRMTGPAHLIESDTKAHRIPRETVGRGKKKRSNTKVIFIPGVGVRAYAKHPGTQGKHPWRKGLAIARPSVPNAVAKAYFAPLRSVF